MSIAFLVATAPAFAADGWQGVQWGASVRTVQDVFKGRVVLVPSGRGRRLCLGNNQVLAETPYTVGSFSFQAHFCFNPNQALEEVGLELLDYSKAYDLAGELTRRYGNPAAKRGASPGGRASASAEWYDGNTIIGYIQTGESAEVAYIGRRSASGGL